MGKFYNIYIKPKEGVTTEQVETKMNLSLDWFRYDSNCYLTYSTSGIKKWHVRLKPLVQKGGRLFITEINPKKKNGWMIPDFWDWINKER